MKDCINPECDNEEKGGKLCDKCFDKYMTDIEFARKMHRIEGEASE